MGAIGGPILPIHVKDHGDQNVLYCRRCRHRFGGAYGAISAGACEWNFCPYCGVEIVQTNPSHQPAEEVWRRDLGDWAKGLPPAVWDDVIEGRARDRTTCKLLPSGEAGREAVAGGSG